MSSFPELIRMTRYERRADNEAKPIEISREDFLSVFLEHERTSCAPCSPHSCPKKDGEAWSPGIIVPCIQPCSCPMYVPRKGRSVKSCLRRCSENVKEISLAFFDLDSHVDKNDPSKSKIFTQARLEEVCAKLDSKGYEAIITSTHSHRPDAMALRLILPLTRPIKPIEYPRFWLTMASWLGTNVADPKAKDPSRIFYLPSACEGLEVVEIYSGAGSAVDVDEILAQSKANAVRAAGPGPSTPLERRPAPIVAGGEVDLERLRDILRRYRPTRGEVGEKKDFVRRILEGEPLAGDGERDTAILRATQILAYQFPRGVPREAVMELLRPSVVSLPGGPPDAPFTNWMEVAAEKWDRAVEKALKSDEERAAAREKLKQLRGRQYESNESQNPKVEAVPEDVDDDFDEPPEEEIDWRSFLCTKPLPSGEVIVTSDGANVETVLTHSEDCKGSFRFNSVTKKIEVCGGPYEAEAKKVGEDGFPTVVGNWFRRIWNFVLPDSVVGAQIFVTAMKNSYNPVQEYLNGIKWDGEKRVDSFLEVHCRAKTVGQRGEDISEYVRTVSAKWLIGAVARAMQPGCKMDNVLMLEGKQYIGKSTAIRELGSPWFSASRIEIGSKDSMLLTAQNWIVEMPELAALKRAEARLQKALFSNEEDEFRVPYGKVMRKYPRQCVFVGTTNDKEYLSDPTGNRRFWVISCEGDFDLEHTRRERDQVWAEAVVRYKAGETWWMTRAQTEVSEEQAELRVHSSAIHDAVREWWFKMTPERRPEQFSMLEVIEGLGLTSASVEGKSVETKVGIVLAKMGFSKTRFVEAGVRYYVFVPTQELRNAPRLDMKKRHLTVVPGLKTDGPEESLKN